MRIFEESTACLNFSGGYAFFETSQLPDSPKAQNTVSAMMTSPTLESTGSEGFCVTFRCVSLMNERDAAVRSFVRSFVPVSLLNATQSFLLSEVVAPVWLATCVFPSSWDISEKSPVRPSRVMSISSLNVSFSSLDV